MGDGPDCCVALGIGKLWTSLLQTTGSIGTLLQQTSQQEFAAAQGPSPWVRASSGLQIQS
jgi:hypothetical protein